jgi:NAD(P)-dependent dehydrogenase (short-subunit alcohol dehydrogenase family)
MARWTTGLGLLALGALAVWGTSGARRLRPKSLAGQAVLITGGSRGLGLCLARELAGQGCRLAICARDEAELARARASLEQDYPGVEVLTGVVDVGDRQAVDAFVEQATLRFGTLDGLVNVAGIIQVGPLDAMALEDFEAIMRVNFFGALHAAWAVLPAMKARGRGWICNIDSIGGRVAPPHLVPYQCSKFALRGLSEGLDAELAAHGIEVITILPGLMRTGSPVNALFKGQREQEFAWFGLGDVLPGLSLGAEDAARRIVAAIRLGKREVNLGLLANAGGLIHDLLPGATLAVFELANRLMPGYHGRPNQARRGQELEDTRVEPLVTFIDDLGSPFNEVR